MFDRVFKMVYGPFNSVRCQLIEVITTFEIRNIGLIILGARAMLLLDARHFELQLFTESAGDRFISGEEVGRMANVLGAPKMTVIFGIDEFHTDR